MKDIKEIFEENRSLAIYLIVGAGISGSNILLLYVFIDILSIPTLLSSAIVVGGTFILRFFIYKWTGFTK